MFIVISSCLAFPMMVLQSYKIYIDEIHKKLNNGLNQKVTSKVPTIRYKYRRQFMLTTAV